MEVFILARPRGRDRESLQCQVSPCASLHAAPRQAEAAASSTEELLASAQGQAVAREEPEGEGAEADPEAA